MQKKKKSQKKKKRFKISSIFITLFFIISVFAVIIPIMHYENVTEITTIEELENIKNKSDSNNFFTTESYVLDPKTFEYIGNFEYKKMHYSKHRYKMKDFHAKLYSFTFDNTKMYGITAVDGNPQMFHFEDYKKHYIEVDTVSNYDVISLPDESINEDDYIIIFRDREEDLTFKVILVAVFIIGTIYRFRKD